MIELEQVSLSDFAGYISEELRKRGIDTILVGGACVTIFSENRYQSFDLDFVVYEEMRAVEKGLKELGFEKKTHYFTHPRCQWLIEFVSSPVAVGKEILSQFHEEKVSTGVVKMLRPEDSIKDRLASFFYWDDYQGLDQAIEISLAKDVSLKEIENWAIREGFGDKFGQFISRISASTSS